MKLARFGSLLVAGALGLVSAVHAQTLYIHNNTDFPSTTVANNGPCSSILKDGVTQPHSTNPVSEGSLKAACIKNKENCDARVYLTSNCTGPVTAKVVFSITTGIKSHETIDANYCLKVNGPFDITMDVKDSATCNNA